MHSLEDHGFGASAGDPVAPGWRRTVEPQGPVVAAVSADEFATFIEEPCPPDDSSVRGQLLTQFRTMATAQAIAYMDRELEKRTIITRFDQYPRSHSARGRLGRFDGHFEFFARLPRVPVASFDKVETVDEDGNAETLDAADYDTDLVSEPARLHIENPPIRGDMAYFAGIRVHYEAGYASDAIPEAIKLGILTHAAYLYERRGAPGKNAITESGAADHYRPYRILTGL